MSVTFEHSAHPQRLLYVPCPAPGHQNPDASLDCELCDYVESGGPSLNVANTNAQALAAWLGLPEFQYGALPVSEFRALVQRALWGRDAQPFTRDEARGQSTRRRRVVRDAEGVSRIVTLGGVRSISFGLDEDRLRAYAERLLAICAVSDSGEIRWA
jgi:hypothetical protein